MGDEALLGLAFVAVVGDCEKRDLAVQRQHTTQVIGEGSLERADWTSVLKGTSPAGVLIASSQTDRMVAGKGGGTIDRSKMQTQRNARRDLKQPCVCRSEEWGRFIPGISTLGREARSYRSIPSCATLASRCPSCAYSDPIASARPAWAAGLRAA